MERKGLALLCLFAIYQTTAASTYTIGKHRETKTTTTTNTPWVKTNPTQQASEPEVTPQEITTTTQTTEKNSNLLQQGIKTIKNILTPTTSQDTTDMIGGYGYEGMGVTGSGAGSVNVETGDIYMEHLVGDINALVTNVTTCDNNVSSGCGAGSVCNVTVGPCNVTTQKVNAAPTELSFTRYLASHQASIVTVQEMMESKTPKVIPLKLTAQNDYTMIIKYQSGGIRDISYMIMALPTETKRVNAIKNLPLGLATYLKGQSGTIIKIYKCPNPTKSSLWTEVSEQKIATSLSDKIALQSNIINVEIEGLGTLAITYRNMRNRNGEKVPAARVLYSHFIR